MEVTLDKKQLDNLSNKILLLPETAKFVLFGKYCFSLEPPEIETFFQIENANGYLLYYQRLLSLVIGLDENQFIIDKSLKRACRTALEKYVDSALYCSGNISLKPHKTAIGIKKLFKNAAIAAIIAAIASSTVLAANTELREKVVSWFIDTFERYSIFQLKNSEEQESDALQNYVPAYVPDGFKLNSTVTQPSLTLLEYSNDNSEYFNVLISMANTKVFLDTENADIEETELSGSKAYFFCKDSVGCLVFEKNGLHFEVQGSISKNDLIKIAESIQEPYSKSA